MSTGEGDETARAQQNLFKSHNFAGSKFVLPPPTFKSSKGFN
jgi:hypothetical protein